MPLGAGIPDSSAAPNFAGPVPPDRAEMTFGELLKQALEVFSSRPLEAEEMMELKAFVIAIDSAARQKAAAGDVAQEGMEAPEDQGIDPNQTEPYGARNGVAKTQGNVPYGFGR